MASTASKLPNIPQTDIDAFHAHITSSTRVLALLGAGLSASSGLPTFRGAGGLWRTHEAMDLATPEAFEENPGLVWQFYNYRRHMALKARPNPAHYALAELSRRMEGFQALSQNVDGLSQRAAHTRTSLHLLHGSLYDIKCTDFYCKYFEQDNFTDPIVPALEIPIDESDPTTREAVSARREEARLAATDGGDSLNESQDFLEKERSFLEKGPNGTPGQRELDIADVEVDLPEIAEKDLPHCPECKTGLLRPGVVWFGEMLPEKVIHAVDNWIVKSPKIDLILVIGTSAKVYPAAGYVQRARAKGARVAVVNMDPNDAPEGVMRNEDWFFVGDAAQIVPELLRPVIGDLDVEMSEKL